MLFSYHNAEPDGTSEKIRAPDPEARPAGGVGQGAGGVGRATAAGHADVDVHQDLAHPRLGGHLNIFFHRTGQAADHRFAHGLADSVHRKEIAGAGNRESGFDDIHAKAFQLQGDLNFLLGI